MTTDLHGAVRTAVDEARRLAQEADAGSGTWHTATNLSVTSFDGNHIEFWSPARALAMCDWADDVLARHAPEEFGTPALICWECSANSLVAAWPCADARALAAAFGVETGETG